MKLGKLRSHPVSDRPYFLRHVDLNLFFTLDVHGDQVHAGARQSFGALGRRPRALNFRGIHPKKSTFFPIYRPGIVKGHRGLGSGPQREPRCRSQKKSSC